MSSAQGSYLKYTCSSRYTRHLHTIAVAKERERFNMPGLLGEVIDIAFQGIAACATGGYYTQPMMEARDMGCSFIVSSAGNLKSAVPLSIQRQHTRTGWRCDDVRQGHTRRDVDQTLSISRSTLPKRTAHVSDTWYACITCGDGNGDVKPDNPSGPGTYGHVV